ncbi:MAG: bifunctional UDP-4-keto-pentose/UDP-xylose synthase [Acidimicrobiia bacterium]|nr:bifunctional UDP-4-keto-pentose/UDP-xylose synthase [Acidimicrobiia bacterium]
MKLVLLGAGGFIGSNLVEYLIARAEHEVVGVDVSAEKLAGISGDNFSFVEADITDAQDLINDVIAGADVVVDLVAYANPSIYVESPLEVVELNFFENLRIAESCIRHNKRLIQYSTSEVYGKNPTSPRFVEDESELILGPVTKQRWIYAASKQVLERMLHGYGLQGDLEYTVVRPFNFVGPRFDYLVEAGTRGGPRVFAHFMSALLTGGPMYLVDGGTQRRCFTHIADANEAFTVLLDHPESINQAFNVGNPATDTSIRDLAILMKGIYADLTGDTPHNELVEISGEEFYGVGYEDTNRVPPDISKLATLGWKPRFDLETTFRDAIQYNLGQDNPSTTMGGAR